MICTISKLANVTIRENSTVIAKIVDEVSSDETDQGLEEHGSEGKDRRLLDHHPERVAAEQIREITQAEEPRLGLVQRREKDRVQGRVDDQPGHDHDQRKAH